RFTAVEKAPAKQAKTTPKDRPSNTRHPAQADDRSYLRPPRKKGADGGHRRRAESPETGGLRAKDESEDTSDGCRQSAPDDHIQSTPVRYACRASERGVYIAGMSGLRTSKQAPRPGVCLLILWVSLPPRRGRRDQHTKKVSGLRPSSRGDGVPHRCA